MNIKTRLYEDFFRPSKDKEYERILKAAISNGYEFHTVLSFEKVIEGRDYEKRYLIIRKDIDTGDFNILRKMLALEKKYGVRSTYYFRWNTLDLGLMQEIEKEGGEASYHYEEIASYCFKHHIKDRSYMLTKLESIRNLFIDNYHRFKEITGLPCLTVSSHGDFVNKIVGTANTILIDNRVRKETGIIREAYDDQHMDMLTCRIADQVERDNFASKAIAAIESGEPVLELLVHPRQWNSPLWINLKEETIRVIKGIYMKL